ncbi:hypothetical protein PJF56_10460 [Roseofilum sp. BLCC_M91]|uniref:Uncharacterized protein n=1 Tax=Roseofilum halophilum BLCC-M91 TaxID=3022259 RepID=A0ABT7BKJ7_9CYAN|nr:hypothetical protein [Roseofilum halophilum]MDJ1179287.1 hypothetical protein [Roseofilum halophilum BLCC-M91]
MGPIAAAIAQTTERKGYLDQRTALFHMLHLTISHLSNWYISTFSLRIFPLQ